MDNTQPKDFTKSNWRIGGRFLQFASQRYLSIQRKVFKALLILEGTGCLQRLEIGPGLQLHVPVRTFGSAGSLTIGRAVHFGYHGAPCVGDGGIKLQPRGADSIISIGQNSWMSNNISMIAMNRISVGESCLIGDMVTIFDCDFHEIDPVRRRDGCGPIGPVNIGNNVWIGSRAMILKGVSIGDNSVIAAASVVTTSIPSNCVAAGCPAKIIRSL